MNHSDRKGPGYGFAKLYLSLGFDLSPHQIIDLSVFDKPSPGTSEQDEIRAKFSEQHVFLCGWYLRTHFFLTIQNLRSLHYRTKVFEKLGFWI